MSAAQKIQQHPTYVKASNTASYYVNQLDKELSAYPALNTFEKRTQVPKAYAALGAGALLVFFHFFNSLAGPVSNLVGWALPAVLSFRALETPGAQDDIQWLTYWVVFGFFNFLESFALSIVLYYFPWYYTFKSIFVIWLQLPSFRGAQVIYLSVLKPVLANLNKNNVVSKPDTTSDVLREKAATATQ